MSDYEITFVYAVDIFTFLPVFKNTMRLSHKQHIKP